MAVMENIKKMLIFELLPSKVKILQGLKRIPLSKRFKNVSFGKHTPRLKSCPDISYFYLFSLSGPGCSNHIS